MNITIRGLQESVFRKFKAKAAEENINLGDAISRAMEVWLNNEKTRTSKARLSDLEITNWGRGTEKSSEEIDKVVYGEVIS
ncbi:MAG: hypothetical protein M1331_01110 [Candidatus Marsarchaeota archaeon]|nr:hypothetical protein [Candidatus Marsarchaeota archaeon]MCL5105983.1 hypothetical protein [Candidatus Marsarchaeota archaeon]